MCDSAAKRKKKNGVAGGGTPGLKHSPPSCSLWLEKSKQIDLILCLEGNSVEIKLIDTAQVTRSIHIYIKDCKWPPPRVHNLSRGLLTYSFQGSAQESAENRKKYAGAAAGQKFLSMARVASIFAKSTKGQR